MTVKEIETLRDERAECPCDECHIIFELCMQLLNEIEKQAGIDL